MNFEAYIETKKHIIWDWNGTLIDDVEHAVSTNNQLLLRHQLPTITVDHYRRVFDFPVRDYYRNLGFDFEQVPFEELCHQFVDIYMSGFRNCSLVAGTQQRLSGVKTRGLVQSILSASDQHSLEQMVDHFELRQHFDFIHGIDNKFAASKLARGQELMVLAGIPASETLLVGDTLHDLEVAQSLGIEVLLLGSGHHCIKRLQAKHQQVLLL